MQILLYLLLRKHLKTPEIKPMKILRKKLKKKLQILSRFLRREQKKIWKPRQKIFQIHFKKLGRQCTSPAEPDNNQQTTLNRQPVRRKIRRKILRLRKKKRRIRTRKNRLKEK